MASTIRSLLLEVGEVKAPVSLRGASEKKDVTFDTATESGAPIKRIEIDGGEDGVEVLIEREVEVPPTGRQRKPRMETVVDRKVAYLPYEGEKVKGVREGDEFFPIKAEEVEQIESLTKLDTLTIQEFIPLKDIPWERAQACYFLAPPKGVGARILATLRDAMENKGVAGVAKLMPKSRQKLAIIHPKHGGLMVTVLAYSDTFAQVVEGVAAIQAAQVTPKVLELMERLIDAKMEEVSVLDQYRDDLIDLKTELIERAKLGVPLVSEETAERDLAEVDRVAATDDVLLERLEASLEALTA